MHVIRLNAPQQCAWQKKELSSLQYFGGDITIFLMYPTLLNETSWAGPSQFLIIPVIGLAHHIQASLAWALSWDALWTHSVVPSPPDSICCCWEYQSFINCCIWVDEWWLIGARMCVYVVYIHAYYLLGNNSRLQYLRFCLLKCILMFLSWAVCTEQW